jgi:hypothetical protein
VRFPRATRLQTCADAALAPGFSVMANAEKRAGPPRRVRDSRGGAGQRRGYGRMEAGDGFGDDEVGI